jgi:hypothetical protein
MVGFGFHDLEFLGRSIRGTIPEIEKHVRLVRDVVSAVVGQLRDTQYQ